MLGAAGLSAAYAVATVVGAPELLMALVFAVVMIPVPFVAWLTYGRAPAALRRLWLLLASAATLWFVGSVVWYALYFAGGGEYPEAPGPSDAIFTAARITAIVGIVVAMRSIVSFRLAALDASVVAAASTAVGAAFVAHGLDDGTDWRSLVLLNGPLLGMLTLMLIVSAALGSSSGLPLSTALVGAAQGLLAAASLLYSYQAVDSGRYVDSRWADPLYMGGAAASYVAAAAILLRVDRPVRLFRVQIPRHPAGSGPVLLLSLAALALTLAVASYGVFERGRPLALVGVITAVAIGVAMVFRARDSIRTAETAYARLDRALAEAERARDDLSDANDELTRANARVRAIHIAYADLLNLADERTHGRLRELIEDTGGELAELLEEELERARER